LNLSILQAFSITDTDTFDKYNFLTICQLQISITNINFLIFSENSISALNCDIRKKEQILKKEKQILFVTIEKSIKKNKKNNNTNLKFVDQLTKKEIENLN